MLRSPHPPPLTPRFRPSTGEDIERPILAETVLALPAGWTMPGANVGSPSTLLSTLEAGDCSGRGGGPCSPSALAHTISASALVPQPLPCACTRGTAVLGVLGAQGVLEVQGVLAALGLLGVLVVLGVLGVLVVLGAMGMTGSKEGEPRRVGPVLPLLTPRKAPPHVLPCGDGSFIILTMGQGERRPRGARSAGSGPHSWVPTPLGTYFSRYPARLVPTSLGTYPMGLDTQGGMYLWGGPGVSVRSCAVRRSQGQGEAQPAASPRREPLCP